MKVQFYALQTDGKQTRELFLFSEDWGLMMTGKEITHEGTAYRVNKLEWIDQAKGVLKAVCLELPEGTETINDVIS